jgi:hypothetical protein
MSIENQVTSVREMLIREMDKSKTIIFDGLLNNSMVNNIPESLFVNYFLPCFVGKVNNPNWVMEWISIAGSPMVEVGILKDNSTEILYYVPSILNTNNVLLHKQSGDIGDIFSRYDQINNNIPMQGLNFLVEALNSKNIELLSKINFSEVNQRWINIFQRYNIVSQLSLNQPNSSSDSGDYFEM